MVGQMSTTGAVRSSPASYHLRYWVVAFTVALAGVTYLDRVCIAVLAPSIMRDLRLTPIQMSYVFSAFTLAYALFEIPTASWADRIGSRAVLTRIVLWWSAFTMLTGAVFGYALFLPFAFSLEPGKPEHGPTRPVSSRAGYRRESADASRASFSRAHI